MSLFTNCDERTQNPESKAHVLMVTEKSKLIVSYVYRLLNMEHMYDSGI